MGLVEEGGSLAFCGAWKKASLAPNDKPNRPPGRPYFTVFVDMNEIRIVLGRGFVARGKVFTAAPFADKYPHPINAQRLGWTEAASCWHPT